MLAYLIESLYRFAQLLNALTLLVLVPERGWRNLDSRLDIRAREGEKPWQPWFDRWVVLNARLAWVCLPGASWSLSPGFGGYCYPWPAYNPTPCSHCWSPSATLGTACPERPFLITIGAAGSPGLVCAPRLRDKSKRIADFPAPPTQQQGIAAGAALRPSGLSARDGGLANRR